jgi:hypothetical protein
MAKVDVSITRSFTINTGNFESIKPTITLTATGVDPEKASDAYLHLDTAITGLMKIEIMSNYGEMKKVQEGLEGYCRNIQPNVPEIGEKIEKSLEKLNEL